MSSSDISSYPVKAIIILTGITVALFPIASDFSSFSENAENMLSVKYRSITIAQSMISGTKEKVRPSQGYGNMPREMWKTAETNGDHCYIPSIPYLDGEDFGVWMNPNNLATTKTLPNYIPSECGEPPATKGYISTTPAKVSKNPGRSIPVKLHIYEIPE